MSKATQLGHGLCEPLNPDQTDSQVQCSRLQAAGPGHGSERWVPRGTLEVAPALAQQCCPQSPGSRGLGTSVTACLAGTHYRRGVPLGQGTLYRDMKCRAAASRGSRDGWGISGQRVTALSRQPARPQPQAPQPANSANPLTSICSPHK